MLNTQTRTGAPQTASSPQESDQLNDFFREYDEHIRAAARRAIPRRLFAREVLDLEIDDLTQQVRIKLWQVLQKQHVILNPKTYIYFVARSGAVDMVRRHKQAAELSLDEYGELVQEILFNTIQADQEAQDPARVFEEQELFHEYIDKTSELIVLLPRCQRQALICSLKDRLEDLYLLSQALGKKGVNVEAVDWPEERVEQRRLKASVSQARKKLRCLLDIYVIQF